MMNRRYLIERNFFGIDVAENFQSTKKRRIFIPVFSQCAVRIIDLDLMSYEHNQPSNLQTLLSVQDTPK